MSDKSVSRHGNFKCYRGTRGKKKKVEPTINDVSNLFTSLLNLSSEHQTRPPRRPKVQTNNTDFIRNNVEIHEMVVEYNDFKQWPVLKNKRKSKKIVSIHTQETDSVQAEKVVSVQSQQVFSVISQSNDMKTPENVITESVSLHINQEVVSPQQQEQISKSKKKRKRRRQSQKIANVSTDISCKESCSVQVQDKDNVKVVLMKKQLTKTFTKSESKEKSITRNEPKSKSKAKSDSDSKFGNKIEDASNKNKKKENCRFPPTLLKNEALQLLDSQSKENPTYVEGNIRINMKLSKHAYLSMPGGEMDILIIGSRDRNRALEGDLVVVRINPEEKWYKHSSEEIQKTGVVVCILEKIHPRKVVGFINKQKNEVIFNPRDSRTPVLKIVNPESLPKNFYMNPGSFKDILFLAKIVFWENPFYALGKLQKTVGNTGNLSVETNAILLENDLDVKPFEDSLLQGLPHSNYIPTLIDLEGREDWRSRCVFTIDPATAVDLDDAVSCKLLENGNFEIGVHISDVTHYLESFTPLDKKVSDRATTVYLVDNVYHMLPKQLCQVCSLLPGQDKLAFSVIWEMTPTAEVISHRFAKTVINSCCQMAYGQAQAMIENPSNDWSQDPSLNIKGNFEISHICEAVNNLYKLSSQIRERRFIGGALRIDQPKLYISLDRETGLPVSCSVEEIKESNKLIEEFMLLANMTVAKQLYDTFPDTAFLRSHKEPSIRILTQSRDMLEKFGVILNIESAGSLQKSLSQYVSEVTADLTDDFAAKCRMMVINSLCAKSMTRAVYRCSNSVKNEDSLRHYALNVPLYTHFTSPIRRYSDCIVHRLLYASIRNEPLHSQWNSLLCTKLASNCNVKKYSAKVAQEQSSELFFTYLLDLKGPVNTQAVVMDVKNRSIDVIIINVGLKTRMYFADIEEKVTVTFSVDHSVPTIRLTWKATDLVQVLSVFSIVNVRIQKHHSLFRVHGIILPPSPDIMNEISEATKEDSQN